MKTQKTEPKKQRGGYRGGARPLKYGEKTVKLRSFQIPESKKEEITRHFEEYLKGYER